MIALDGRETNALLKNPCMIVNIITFGMLSMPIQPKHRMLVANEHGVSILRALVRPVKKFGRMQPIIDVALSIGTV